MKQMIIGIFFFPITPPTTLPLPLSPSFPSLAPVVLCLTLYALGGDVVFTLALIAHVLTNILGFWEKWHLTYALGKISRHYVM